MFWFWGRDEKVRTRHPGKRRASAERGNSRTAGGRNLRFEPLEYRRLLDAVPLLYYKNDTITASTSVLDSSGSGYNGTLTGTFGSTYNTTTGQIDGALSLAGSSGSPAYVSLPGGFATALQSLTNFTISGWVKLTSINDWARMFDFGAGTNDYMFLAPANGNGNVRFAISTSGGGGEQQLTSTTKLSTNNWYFLAVTLSGTTGTLYINGSSAATDSSMTLNPSSLGATTQDWLGRSEFSSDPYLQGGLDDFRVYNSALSGTTISQMYSQGTAIPGALPTSFTATAGAVTSTRVNLAWTNNAASDTGYLVERAADSAFTTNYTSFSLPANSTSYVDNSVVPGSTYYYRVSALMPGNLAASAVCAAVPDVGFELPSENGSYAYEPAGTNWTFAGNSGIAADGSGFGPGSGSGGSQVAFLQSAGASGGTGITGSISQAFSFFTAGNYTISFKAADRNHSGINTQGVSVLLDNNPTPIYTIVPGSGTFATFTTPSFGIGTAGTHTITFEGSVGTSDETAFIDDVASAFVSGFPPTIANAAAASPNSVTAATSNLSVLGADAGGEASLIYTWSLTGTPPAAVSYSANGSNAAKNSVATFTAAGAYNFLVTVTDTNGRTATSSVSVVVNQTLTSVAVTPVTAMVYENATQQFAASALDQFGNALGAQPAFTWNHTGVGSVNASGLYTAGATMGTATVSATTSGITSASAAITVLAPAPNVTTPASASPNPVSGISTALSVLGTDPLGESSLTYTWSLTGTPPASVSYSANGANAAKNTTATFSKAGTYNFLVTLTDPTTATATSSVTVTANQTITGITVSPGATSLNTSATQQFTSTAYDQFGNALVPQPTIVWSAAGNAGATGNTAVGSINSSSGLYTASTTAGMGNVTASAGGVFSTAMVSVGGAQIAAGTTSLSTFGVNAYYAGDTNSCAIAVDNLWTDPASNYQFAAYYTTASEIMIARRQVGASTWQVFDSGIADSTISDDHDVIAIAVDSAGYMHMSWGMHNIPLQYAISGTPVTGAALSSIQFTQLNSSNAPTLFPNSGNDTNEVTYPQFYSIPNSSNLLFTYRNGGSGGGSGNGNQYFDVYNPGSKTFSHNFVINGELTSVNAYLNRMAFDSNGNLLMSWTWRATPNWQSNSNIMFAQSPDVGTTWYQQGGTTQYTLPIIQSGTPAASVSQVVESIPENSSFINQTSMTVDNSNNPLIATYLAPNWNTNTNSGDPNRQYVLYYYSDGQWKSTQITDRTSDTAIDTSGNDVRDLGRPIVLVDKQGRVLVVTRSEDTAMGSYGSTSTPNNDLVVYYCTNLSSGNPTWNSVTLNTTDMGEYEPTYDQNLWQSENELSLFFEPMDLTGQTSGTVQTLDWNEQAYFAPTVATPAAATPAPVTATSTSLSVLGADNTGESNLSYTWSVQGTPPAGVTFSANGTNAAKNTTAAFAKAGSYSFLVTIADSVGQSTTSSVNVTVSQTPTSVAVQPGPLAANGTVTLTATVTDQFGNALSSQPAFSWSLTGGGGLSANVYTPPYASPGSAMISATGDAITGTATVSYPGAAQLASNAGASWAAAGAWTSSSTGMSVAAPGTRGVAGDLATFATGTGGTVRLDGASPSLAGLNFADSGSYTIAPGSGGTLHLADSAATVTVAAGAQTISAPVALDNNVTVAAAAGGSLTISGAVSGNGNSLTVTGGGTVVLSGPGSSDIGSAAVASGKLIVENSTILAAGGSLTVGNAALLTAITNKDKVAGIRAVDAFFAKYATT